MTAVTLQQNAYRAASDQPMRRNEIYMPMVDTAIAAGCIGLSIFTKLVSNSNLALGWAALAALPVVIHGTKLYTNWIPKLFWKMPKGEFIRKITNVPDVKLGLHGWQSNSMHSHHFDENLADALVGFCQNEKLSSHADLDCAGKGEYSAVLRKAGIDSEAFDYSGASRDSYYRLRGGDTFPILTGTKKVDLVTSFEVLSKTLPGQADSFVRNLVDAVKSGGTIAMSCAIPGQRGPNSNCISNEKVIEIFKKYGCKYDASATWKLRRAANPMHIWFKNSLMVFRKTS